MPEMLIISRLTDTARRQDLARRLPVGIDWAFLDASDGHHPETLPPWTAKLLPRTYWDGDTIKPGTFGCFLSHYRAWAECLRQGRPLIVAEDDCQFQGNLDYAQIITLNLDFDLTFLGDGVVGWRNAAPGLAGMDGTLSARQVVQSLDAARITPPNPNAVGSYIYVVTPTGAEKLIALADANGCLVDIDWFVLAASLKGAGLDGPWDAPAVAAEGMNFVAEVTVGLTAKAIANHSLWQELPSVIQHSHLRPIAEYRARIGSAV